MIHPGHASLVLKWCNTLSQVAEEKASKLSLARLWMEQEFAEAAAEQAARQAKLSSAAQAQTTAQRGPKIVLH